VLFHCFLCRTLPTLQFTAFIIRAVVFPVSASRGHIEPQNSYVTISDDIVVPRCSPNGTVPIVELLTRTVWIFDCVTYCVIWMNTNYIALRHPHWMQNNTVTTQNIWTALYDPRSSLKSDILVVNKFRVPFRKSEMSSLVECRLLFHIMFDWNQF
jgi:hypothetical protein